MLENHLWFDRVMTNLFPSEICTHGVNSANKFLNYVCSV